MDSWARDVAAAAERVNRTAATCSPRNHDVTCQDRGYPAGFICVDGACYTP